MKWINRCEGWTRTGGVFTLGPVRWDQCESESIVFLTIKQEGKKERLPSCQSCWNETIENKITIIKVEPIKVEVIEE